MTTVKCKSSFIFLFTVSGERKQAYSHFEKQTRVFLKIMFKGYEKL